MRAPLAQAPASFLEGETDPGRVDDDTLAGVVHNYRRTVLSGRVPGLVALHDADLLRDPRAGLRRLARALGIEADGATVEAIARATEIGAMRAAAGRYAPDGVTGFWRSDAAFFARGVTGNWKAAPSGAQTAAYRARRAALRPEPEARRWLESGGA